MREPIVPQLDADQFVVWESQQAERFELHHGFVFGFARGSAGHDRVAFDLRSALEALYAPSCRTFGSDMKVRIRDDVVYYPDVTVVCGKVDDASSIVERPMLVAEVLSPSTRRYDLVDKRAAYRFVPSLEAYVVVHGDTMRVEVDRRDGASGRWRTDVIGDGDVMLPGGVVALASIYARTALAESSS